MLPTAVSGGQREKHRTTTRRQRNRLTDLDQIFHAQASARPVQLLGHCSRCGAPLTTGRESVMPVKVMREQALSFARPETRKGSRHRFRLLPSEDLVIRKS